MLCLHWKRVYDKKVLWQAAEGKKHKNTVDRKAVTALLHSQEKVGTAECALRLLHAVLSGYAGSFAAVLIMQEHALEVCFLPVLPVRTSQFLSVHSMQVQIMARQYFLL